MRLQDVLTQGARMIRREGWHPDAYLRLIEGATGPTRFHVEHETLRTKASGSIRMPDIQRIFCNDEPVNDWEEWSTSVAAKRRADQSS